MSFDKVIELLQKRGRAHTAEIVREAGLRWADALDMLSALEREGVISRAEVLDPTKPLATAVWELRRVEVSKRPEGPLGVVTNLILNPPLLRDLRETPPASVGLLDSLSYIVNLASKSLRIAMPYIGELMAVLFAQHLQDLKRLSTLRVIAEDSKSNRRALEPLKEYLPNLEVRYATRWAGGVKVAGAHLKMMIADERAAIVGTFNLTQLHLLVNYDIGMLVHGEVVRHLTKIFDTIWDRLAGGACGQA